MATVTLRGAGGTTVTLTNLSDAAAPAAQAVLAKVDQFIELGLLDQFVWPGSGTVTAPSNLLGGVIVQGAGGDVGALQGQYVSTVVDATGPATVIGPSNANATVVAGSGGLLYLNRSTAGEMVLAGGGHGVFQARNGAGARVTLDGALVAGAMDGISGGAMTISALAGALVLVAPHGANRVAIQAADGAAVVTAVSAPEGDAPATIRGGVGTAITHLAVGGGAFIQPGAGNATVFGSAGSGSVTVFGGTLGSETAPAFTGSLTVAEGRGLFVGGSAGGNIMTTDTVPGAATLVGGGNGDVLISRGAGNALFAGAGNETLSGFGVAATVGGATFFAGNGSAVIFGNSGGGNTFGLGAGVSQVDGRNETAISAAGLGQGAGNTYFVTTGAGGGHVVADFVPGLDRFNMSFTTATGGQTLAGGGLSFFAAGDGSAENPFLGTGRAGTVMTLSGGTKLFFYDAKVTAGDLV